MESFRDDDTTVIDVAGRTVIPGLNDVHSHTVRGGRFFNLETRWEGIPTLAQALDLVRTEAGRVPDGQWVRVIGGWSPYQFEERRMPTVQELNEAAPDTPVFVLFLYSMGFLNEAGVQAMVLTADTQTPEGTRIEFVDGGAILHAEPNPAILYKAIADLPQLSAEDQVNSTLHYYRDLNRLGLTSTSDAGGGGHLFPTDYAGSLEVATNDGLPLRVSYYLFAQTAGEEAEDFSAWIAKTRSGRMPMPISTTAMSWKAQVSFWPTASVTGKTFWPPHRTLNSARPMARTSRAICIGSPRCWSKPAGPCGSTQPMATASV